MIRVRKLDGTSVVVNYPQIAKDSIAECFLVDRPNERRCSPESILALVALDDVSQLEVSGTSAGGTVAALVAVPAVLLGILLLVHQSECATNPGSTFAC